MFRILAMYISIHMCVVSWFLGLFLDLSMRFIRLQASVMVQKFSLLRSMETL